MDGEDQVPLAPAVLGYATQPLPGGGLVCDLPCLPCGDAFSVAGVGGSGGDGTTGAHALRATPVCGDVLDEKGPAGLRRVLPLGWQESRDHVHVGSVRGGGQQVEAQARLPDAGIPVAIQCWLWKAAHGLFFFCFPFGCLGRCCEACLALSCS